MQSFVRERMFEVNISTWSERRATDSRRPSFFVDWPDFFLFVAETHTCKPDAHLNGSRDPLKQIAANKVRSEHNETTKRATEKA